MSGWIKLWRSAIDHPCLRNFDELGVWTQLLARAARQPYCARYRKRAINLQAGQLVISVRSWAREGGIGHKRLRSILSLFNEQGMIEAKTGTDDGTGKVTDFTLITICNYEHYQSRDTNEGHINGHDIGHNEGTVRAQLGHTEQEEKKVEKVEKHSPPKAPLSQPDEFDEFWTAYPAKVGKGQARRAWNGAVKKTDPASIIDGLRTAIRRGQFDRDTKYIPHPSTWLNGERWADKPALPMATPRPEPWQTL